MPDSVLYPSVQANENSVGTVDWELAYEDVFSDDNGFVYVPLADGDQSHYLFATGFGFSIPAGATITSIVVRIGRKVNIVGGGDYPDILMASVRLLRYGALAGDDQPGEPYAWSATEGVSQHGDQSGEDGLWGLSWGEGDVNDAGFGVAISATASGGIYPANAEIDYVTIQVNYSELGTGDSLPQVITVRASLRDDEPAKPRTVYAFNGDVILDPVVDDYYGGAVAVLRPTHADGDEESRRPLLSYVSAADWTEAAVFAWQPQCLVVSAVEDDDDHSGRRSIAVAPALVIPYESDCACFGSVVKGPSGSGTVTKTEATDTQTARSGSVVKGPSGSGTASKPFCGC
jgi:hypothetical protein